MSLPGLRHRTALSRIDTDAAARSVVAALDALFGPLGQPRTPVPWARFFALSAVLLAVIFVRRPDIVTNPQFFAEDGFVYFPQNILLGSRAFLELYHGFPHFAHKLIAALAGPLPVLHAPRFYCTAAALLTALGLASFVLPSFRHLIRRDGLRAFFSLGVVTMPLVPFGEQTIGTVANVGWFLGVWLTLSAVMQRPRSAWGTVGMAVTAAGGALSTPLAVVNIPLWSLRLLRAVARRDRLDAFYAGLPLVLFCVTVAATPNLGARTELPLGKDRLSFEPSMLASYLPARTALSVAPLDTVRTIRDSNAAALPALACGGAAALLLFGIRKPGAVPALLLAFYGFVVSMLITLMGRVTLGLIDPLLPPARYGVFPAAMLYLVPVALLDALPPGRPLILATVLVAAMWSWVRQASFFVPALPDWNWPDHGPRFERALRERCPVRLNVPLNPRYNSMDVIWGPEFPEIPTTRIAASLVGGSVLTQKFTSRCEGLSEVAFSLRPMPGTHSGALHMDLYGGQDGPLASVTIGLATLNPAWNVFCFPPIPGSRDATFLVTLRVVDSDPAAVVRLRASTNDSVAEGRAEVDGARLDQRVALMHGCVDRDVPRIPIIDILQSQ